MEIKDVKEVYNAAEAKVIASAGFSSPLWVTWIVENLHIFYSLAIPAATLVYIILGAKNRFYQGRADWKRRLDDERKSLLARRKNDE